MYLFIYLLEIFNIFLQISNTINNTYVCVCMRVCIYMCVCVCVCIYVYMCVCVLGLGDMGQKIITIIIFISVDIDNYHDKCQIYFFQV